MSFLQNFADAVANYPVDSVTVSIVDVFGPTAGWVHANRVVPFQVRVANNGHLNMTNVSLHIEALNGALVSSVETGPFFTGITFGALTVNGGASQDTATLYFKAPSVTKPAGTTMLRAHIGDWDANLDHMFDNHTNHAPLPEGAYSVEVRQ